MRVLAVAQVLHLLEDERRGGSGRSLPGDLVEVGGDLGVVGGDDAERLGGQPLAELGGDAAPLPELGDDLRVVGRVGDGGDPGVVAGRRRRGAPPRRRRSSRSPRRGRRGRSPTSGANGLTLTTTRSMSPIAVLGQLGELLGPVAAGEDAGVDGRVERLDLAADERRDARSGRRPEATSMPSAARCSRVPSVA